MVETLRIRDDKLNQIQRLIDNQEGGVNTLRWEVAKYRIKKALAKLEQDINNGINEQDLKYLYEQEIIQPLVVEEILAHLPILKNKRLQLDEIKKYFFEKFIPSNNLGIFLDSYLNVELNSAQVWKKFQKGHFINKTSFQLFCKVLRLKWKEVGISHQDESKSEQEKIKISSELELALSCLNHQNQLFSYDNFLRCSVLGFRIVDISQKGCIRPYWLLKRLFPKNEQNWKCGLIKFNSNYLYNLGHQLSHLGYQLELQGDICHQIDHKEKEQLSPQDLQSFSKSLIKKITRSKANIIFELQTEQGDQIEQLKDFINIIEQPIITELKQIRSSQFKPKIVFVWLDYSLSSQPPTVGIFNNEIPVVSHFSRTELITWINEQQIITKLSQWKSGLNFLETPEQFLEEIWREVDVIIPDNPDIIEPEKVLEIFYKFILNNWENYKPSWQKL